MVRYLFGSHLFFLCESQRISACSRVRLSLCASSGAYSIVVASASSSSCLSACLSSVSSSFWSFPSESASAPFDSSLYANAYADAAVVFVFLRFFI